MDLLSSTHRTSLQMNLHHYPDFKGVNFDFLLLRIVTTMPRRMGVGREGCQVVSMGGFS